MTERVSDPDTLKIREAATLLKLPVSTVYRQVKAQHIPGVKIGKHWRFSRQVLIDWLQARSRFHVGRDLWNLDRETRPTPTPEKTGPRIVSA